MTRRRLFCSRRKLADGVFTLTGPEAHHGVSVCRLRPGDEVGIFTERAVEFRCEVLSAGKGQLKARVIERLADEVESPLRITLVQALPRAVKIEEIIAHATELGLTRLVPVVSERSFGAPHGEAKRERWRRLALEAVKQCGRRGIPDIEPPIPLERLKFDSFQNELRVLACERGCAGDLSALVDGYRRSTEQGGRQPAAVIACGPEGGFTEQETAMFLDAGFACVSMGARVLRAETASLALMAVLQYELGDWRRPAGSDRRCARSDRSSE